MTVRVLVADDHEVVRSGLANMLNGGEFQVVAQAANGAEAVRLAREHRPDVVLMDIRMPHCDGLSALEELRRELPPLPIVVLSTYDNPTYIARALALGAADYLLKGCSREELLASVVAAAKGAPPSRSEPARRVAGVMSRRREPVDEETALTRRESQVLRHVALGLSNKEIGQALEISVETVKEHVQKVLKKIHVNDRTQAAVWAVRKGLV
jgi:DNA-binding NarL/FixJ family response regulator